MKKKKVLLKLNKKVISKLTESSIKGGTYGSNTPSAGGSCLCGGSHTCGGLQVCYTPSETKCC
ncbi:hypothetical protein [Flagellimonas oceanensis]|uniref:hypothetical protein n=1 Tax=Flagellimonas oceanensis TaxID=2499163 RepID=UPI000F8CCD44|nr:hypothetical protein [Allomuricauda oceanensis]